jgi:hypothetical protein
MPSLDVISILVDGHEYYFCFATSLPKFGAYLDSIEKRHRDIEYDKIEIERFRGLQSCFSVLCTTDDLKIVPKQPGNLLKHFWRIVSQQNSSRFQVSP